MEMTGSAKGQVAGALETASDFDQGAVHEIERAAASARRYVRALHQDQELSLAYEGPPLSRLPSITR